MILTLDRTGLSWTLAGEPTRKQLAEIRRISLQKVLEGEGEVTVYSCAITFDDGRLLRVTSKTAMLESPGSRNDAYRDFVHALHRRLGAEQRARISFYGGTRRPRAQVALGLSLVAIWFVVALGGFLALDRPEDNPWFLVPIFFALFVIFPLPFYLIPSQPLPYSPDAIPPQQLP